MLKVETGIKIKDEFDIRFSVFQPSRTTTDI